MIAEDYMKNKKEITLIIATVLVVLLGTFQLSVSMIIGDMKKHSTLNILDKVIYPVEVQLL